MKILIDMNLSNKWVEVLQNNGFKAAHWSTVGEPTASDEEIVKYAILNGYVIFTHDLDFSAILSATHEDKPSVIQVRGDPCIKNISTQVVNALKQVTSELENGALVTINVKTIRLRVLPLKKTL
jgi:predicted nuclease of predicted toxin-antitoxin system